MQIYLAVGIGGMAGALARYGISVLFASVSGFPIATLIANLIGCFLLSYLLNQPRIKKILSEKVYTALSTGLIGSFTTFSTFAVETIALWHVSASLTFTYVLISIAGGLLFAYAGFQTAGKQVNR
ncbi:fluoride efflux transporter FluC [Virgibacillus siamensis]|uniref:fluoride efflux transporter FluC n=1 Tax=Virgibacillus siamensis TaxID=480071 RepID=UPI000986975B|nr:CrcB family protein [Virgibacillus siamensis]